MAKTSDQTEFKVRNSSIRIGEDRNAMRITVGVCVKDSEKTIKEAFSSVLDQKHLKEPMHVIVVDGCSRDKTLSIINSMASETGMLVDMLSDDGKGLAAARQMVVDNAKGDYIIFVDGDVEIQKDFIRRQVDYMEKHPQVGVAVGKYMFKEGNLVSAVWSLYNQVSSFLGNDATIYRSEAIKQVGGFDQNIKGASEDKDMILRIIRKGWAFSVNEKARFYHNCRQGVREFWNEQNWFGFGNHYLNHKHRNLGPLWRNLSIGSFIYGSKLGRKSYILTNKKISFLIPLLMVFGNIAWWIGFINAHLNGYGHQIKLTEETSNTVDHQQIRFDAQHCLPNHECRHLFLSQVKLSEKTLKISKVSATGSFQASALFLVASMLLRTLL